MADVLLAMGFPSEWCERALRSTSGIEPAVELLLQWQANGEAPAGAGGLPTLHLSPANPSTSTPAVSTVTASAGAGAGGGGGGGGGGSDAVVPDAYADERKRRADAAMRQKKEQEAEKVKVRQHMQEDKAHRQWRNQLATAPAAAPSSPAGVSKSEDLVELQIRCSGHPNMKGTFSADATLKDVREFVLQEFERQQLPQATAMPSHGGGRRGRPMRPLPFSGASAALSSDRVAQRAIMQAARENFDLQTNRILVQAKSMRNVQSTSGAEALPNQGKETSMETSLRQANLFPRGTLTAQFQSKDDASSSKLDNIPSEHIGQGQGDIQLGPVPVQPARFVEFGQPVEDVEMREQRLKATVDRLSERRPSGTLDMGAPAVAASLRTPLSTAAPASTPPAVALSREERTLEVDGERVRHRELALQAAAKRMSEAAQIFREGLPPDEGESGGGFQTPSDIPPGVVLGNHNGNMQESSNLHLSRLAKFSPGNQDVKGKQAADCGPSTCHMQPADSQVVDVGSQNAGRLARTSRARVPLSSPLLNRPEKLQRTQEALNSSVADVNYESTYAPRGHAGELAGRREDFEEMTNERENEGSSSSGSTLTSELRIRLEDGNIVRHSFPAHTTLQAVCESVIPESSTTAEYGLIIPLPGSHFLEGETLNSTLQEVGLVPRGMVHLQKVASRGLVTQGRRRARHGMRYVHSDDETEPELEQLWQDFSRHMNPNLSYEELVELEDSIGRVNVGVPEATIANMPTHVVARSDGDICIVCLAEMAEGEEVMSLPCVHTFHPACIRQWLLQSTCCPTCKHSLT